MENLLSRISFEGIQEGSYREEVRAQAIYPLSRPVSRSPTVKRAIRESVYGDDFLSPTKGVGSLSFDSYQLLEAALEVSTLESRTKTDELKLLETLLSIEYKSPNLEITRVESLPKSRKEVKRIYFVIGNDMYQVWLYKADPKETTRELNICRIVYERGIPTAKPIGHVPKIGEDYPYQVAVLGGIVEHAGESYDQLINNLQLSPDRIFDTARGVARLLADFHFKLTSARRVFEASGIHLGRASPRKEILERLVAGIGIMPNEAEQLISACEDLYRRQEGELVVSHGDSHTGNIVTKETPNHSLGGQMRTSLTDFGIIDFGSLCLDYPEGDLVDFWIHHQRKAQGVFRSYKFDVRDVEKEYAEELERSAGSNRLNSKNISIQQTLWNIYEMYDPTRKSSQLEKASYHYDGFVKSGEVLKVLGLEKDFSRIRRELDRIKKAHPLETFSLFK